MKGTLNIADSLARMIRNPDSNDVSGEHLIRSIIHQSVPVSVTWSELVTEIRKDEELQRVLEAVRLASWDGVPLFYRTIKEEFAEIEGLLVRQDRTVIPKRLRTEMSRLAHEGHPGINNMKARLRGKIWCPINDR